MNSGLGSVRLPSLKAARLAGHRRKEPIPQRRFAAPTRLRSVMRRFATSRRGKLQICRSDHACRQASSDVRIRGYRVGCRSRADPFAVAFNFADMDRAGPLLPMWTARVFRWLPLALIASTEAPRFPMTLPLAISRPDAWNCIASAATSLIPQQGACSWTIRARSTSTVLSGGRFCPDTCSPRVTSQSSCAQQHTGNRGAYRADDRAKSTIPPPGNSPPVRNIPASNNDWQPVRPAGRTSASSAKWPTLAGTCRRQHDPSGRPHRLDRAALP